MQEKQIILFDGDCNLCNQSVQFIIKRDPEATFSFASLESEIGKSYLKKHHLQENLNSMVLIKEKHAYVKSMAALQIARHLKGTWKLSYFFTVIPQPIRDIFYDFVATYRYRWFSQKNKCAIPSSEMRKRFLSL